MNTYDLRNYKSVIRDAVKREPDSDPNWKWKVKAINKMEIRIGWGYLDWLCDGKRDEFFSVKLLIDNLGDEPDLSLAGFYPDDSTLRESLYCWIGDKHWNDAKTIEDGLKMIIHGIANRAHNTF